MTTPQEVKATPKLNVDMGKMRHPIACLTCGLQATPTNDVQIYSASEEGRPDEPYCEVHAPMVKSTIKAEHAVTSAGTNRFQVVFAATGLPVVPSEYFPTDAEAEAAKSALEQKYAGRIHKLAVKEVS